MNLNEAHQILNKAGYKLVKKQKMNESLFAISIDAMAQEIIKKLNIDLEQTEEDLRGNNEGMSTYAIITTEEPGLLKDLTNAIKAYKPNTECACNFDPAYAEFEGDDIYVPFDEVVYYDDGLANVKQVIRFAIMASYPIFKKYSSFVKN